jgi:hypothetical protein
MYRPTNIRVSRTPSPPPPPRPYPLYPIPIPPDKFTKALQLYRTYRLADALSRSQLEPQSRTNFHDGFHLGISIDEPESLSSTKVEVDAELLLSNEGKVKQRARRKLSPATKAKSALIRYLGSCWVCRSRRVAVS